MPWRKQTNPSTQAGSASPLCIRREGGQREEKEKEREREREREQERAKGKPWWVCVLGDLLAKCLAGSSGSNLAVAPAKQAGLTATHGQAKSESGQVSNITSGDSAAGSA